MSLNGWEMKSLDNVAYLAGRIGWKGLTKREYTKEGPYFLSVHGLNYGDFVDFQDAFHISQERYDESPEIMLQGDDVLLCKDGAGIGKVGIVNKLPGPSTINSSLLLIRAGERLLPKFLYYNFLGPYFQRIVQDRIDGATTPHLYQKDIKTFLVPVPDEAEQKRIVSILDEALGAIQRAKENAQKNLANARELFESYLNRVFTEKGEGWEEKELGNLGRTQTGSTPKKANTDHYGDYIPFVKPADFRSNGTLSLGNAGLSKVGLENAREVPAGSALMVCIGATIGKSGFCESAITTNQQSNAFIPNEEVDYRFAYYAFITRAFQQEVRRNSGQATLPIISKSKWSRLTISFPDRDEQSRIVATLDGIKQQQLSFESVIDRRLPALDELKQSILQKAFTGQLTAKSPELEAVG